MIMVLPARLLAAVALRDRRDAAAYVGIAALGAGFSAPVASAIPLTNPSF